MVWTNKMMARVCEHPWETKEMVWTNKKMMVKVCEHLKSKWRTEEQASQLTDSRTSHIGQPTRKLFLANINHNLVKCESL